MCNLQHGTLNTTIRVHKQSRRAVKSVRIHLNVWFWVLARLHRGSPKENKKQNINKKKVCLNYLKIRKKYRSASFTDWKRPQLNEVHGVAKIRGISFVLLEENCWSAQVWCLKHVSWFVLCALEHFHKSIRSQILSLLLISPLKPDITNPENY